MTMGITLVFLPPQLLRGWKEGKSVTRMPFIIPYQIEFSMSNSGFIVLRFRRFGFGVIKIILIYIRKKSPNS